MAIPLPITANYIFQTLGTIFSSDKKQVRNITSSSPCILSSRNTTFIELQQNSFKYQFIYKYNLADFIGGAKNPEIAGRSIILSHDQIRLNYQIPLDDPISVNDILKSFELSNRMPLQKCDIGNPVSSGEYVKVFPQALSTILSECPVDVSKIADFHPVYYIGDFKFGTVCGQTTDKKTTTAVMRYRECPDQPVKVLLSNLCLFLKINSIKNTILIIVNSIKITCIYILV